MALTEHAPVGRTPVSRTRASLAVNFGRLGVARGDVLIVHASLSAIGWVAGGAQAVVEALLDVLSARGAPVMPAHPTRLGDPAGWENPPIPAGWHEAVRASLPAHDPYRTPPRGMGAVAELFRTWPGALRGAHPTLSFAARGPQAERIVLARPLCDPMGEDGLLGRPCGPGARARQGRPAHPGTARSGAPQAYLRRTGPRRCRTTSSPSAPRRGG